MKAFLSLIRWKNIAIIALYQYLLYFFLIIPAFNQAAISPQLSPFLVVLFIFCTLCIAISANIINDLLDVKTDQINKPGSPLVSGAISSRQVWGAYLFFIIAGFITAVVIAFLIDKIYLTGIYLLMQFLVYWYSKDLKNRGLPGNIFVSFSLAFVSLIMVVSEPKLFQNNALTYCRNLIIAFSVFVFLINLGRELVKDMEDMLGDKAAGIRTFPIIYGVKSTKFLAGATLFILVISLVIWTFLNNQLDFRLRSFPLISIAGPLALSIFRIYKADLKIHYSKISKLLKFIMFLGIMYLYLIIKYSFQ